jgi:hypothetical protein
VVTREGLTPQFILLPEKAAGPDQDDQAGGAGFRPALHLAYSRALHLAGEHLEIKIANTWGECIDTAGQRSLRQI